MDALKQLIPILVSASLAALVVAVGMGAERGDLLYVLRRPKLLGRAVLSVNVVVPIAAGLLVAVMAPPPLAAVGIMLMAVSPVPPLVPGRLLQAGAARCYAYGLYFALALLSIVVVPLSVAIGGRIYGSSVSVSVAEVARTVFVGVLVPLAVGVLVRRVAPRFAERASPIVVKFSMLLLVAALVPLLIRAWPAVAALIGNGTMLAMAVVSAVALASGHLLGGPDPSHRPALALASATRHPGIAMLIAKTNDNARAAAAVLLFLLVSLLVSAVYQAWLRRSSARAAGPAGG